MSRETSRKHSKPQLAVVDRTRARIPAATASGSVSGTQCPASNSTTSYVPPGEVSRERSARRPDPDASWPHPKPGCRPSHDQRCGPWQARRCPAGRSRHRRWPRFDSPVAGWVELYGYSRAASEWCAQPLSVQPSGDGFESRGLLWKSMQQDDRRSVGRPGVDNLEAQPRA